MTARLGLMGFGRIGRNVFRLLHGRDDLEIVVIDDVADPEGLTYLLEYDSIYGRFDGKVEYRDGKIAYGDNDIVFRSTRDPSDTAWSDDGVDIVIDTTSRFLDKESLGGHLANGAKRVILTSSPETPGEIPLLIRGINDRLLEDHPPIVALGSNTANAAAPVLRAIDHAFGLDRAFITTVKAMSNAGRLADVPSDTFRGSRAAGENIIPSETNSADVITQALPELAGRLAVTALMVPVPDGSNVDMVAAIDREVTVEELNNAVASASSTDFAGILEYVDDPIVSSDVRMSPYSGVFDSLATMVTGGNLVKTITWFNNGWGYSNRVVEVAARIAAEGGSR